MSVRNLCVARGTIQNPTSAPLYTVPADSVLLLKSMIFTAGGGAAAPLVIQLHSSSPSVQIDYLNQTPSSSGHLEWSGWVALNAGDELLAYYPGAGLLYWISGAVLPNV